MFEKLLEKIPEFIKLIRVLTLRRILNLAVLAGLVGIVFVGWGARQEVTTFVKLKVSAFGQVQHSGTIVGTADTMKAIKKLVNKSSLVVGLQLVNIDIRTNSRSTAGEFYADHQTLQIAVDLAISSKVAPTPLFITGNTVNNDRLTEVMRGIFVCYESKDTLFSTMAPEVLDVAPWMCSISIPPYEGNFQGYMNLFLAKKPSDREVEELRTAARILAADIYERELSH